MPLHPNHDLIHSFIIYCFKFPRVFVYLHVQKLRFPTKIKTENRKQFGKRRPRSATREPKGGVRQAGASGRTFLATVYRCGRKKEKKGGCVLQLIKFFFVVFLLQNSPTETDCSWAALTDGRLRSLSLYEGPSDFWVKCFLDKGVRKFRERLYCWFDLATIYTIMINDLLITTTDRYRYLCFALFNILLFRCSKQWQLQ